MPEDCPNVQLSPHCISVSVCYFRGCKFIGLSHTDSVVINSGASISFKRSLTSGAKLWISSAKDSACQYDKSSLCLFPNACHRFSQNMSAYF